MSSDFKRLLWAISESMQENQFDFTVLMSVYRNDDAAFFTRAVDSVYQNDLLPVEMVLVVDGPVDALLENAIIQVVERYRINCYRLPHNSGLAAALNHGLRFVRTPWVARADADDFNLPKRFSAQIKRAQQGFDLVGSYIQEMNASGEPLKMRKVPCEHDAIVAFAARRNPFNHMSVMFRTELAKECGGYPLLHLREDYGLWALMISMGAKLSNIDQVLVLATAGDGMVSRRRGLHSALAEVDLQKHLRQCGLKGTFAATLDILIRGGLLLLPAPLLSVVYNNFLRRNK